MKKVKKVKKVKEKLYFANKYPPFEEWTWKPYYENRIVDPNDFIKDNVDWDFYIGTDSKTYNKTTVYTTVIVCYKKGLGGKSIYHTDKTQAPLSLRHQLLLEAMRSLEAAFYVNKRIPSESIISLHLDVSSNLRWKSGRYMEELVGMVVAQGFNVACKPDSWASSSVADRKT